MDEDNLFGSNGLFTSFDDKNKTRGRQAASQNRSAVNKIELSENCNEISVEGNADLKVESERGFVVVGKTGSEIKENEIEGGKEVSVQNLGTGGAVKSDKQRDEPDAVKASKPRLPSTATGLPETVKEDNESCKCSHCPHLEELSRLKQENKQLLQQVQELQAQCCVTSVQSSEVEIKFLNKTLERKYRQDVENFIWQLVGKTGSKSGHSNKDESLYNLDTCSDFYIDKKSVTDLMLKNESYSLPSYNNNFTETMDSENKNTADDSQTTKSIKATCFNCLGNHMLQECPVEKDRQRIAMNRQEYLNKSGSGASKQNRYHADSDLMFSSFKPGVLSKSLRHALGLHRKDLPFFIYKMRQLGYPPGWLKEAEICSSGLTMYDSAGKEIAGDVLEDGEVGRSTDIRVQYDPNRLVDYPGFNVFPERGIKDKCRKYGFPPMQDFQMKHNVMKCMKAPEPQPYKRKMAASLPNPKRARTSYEVSDMDLEEAEEKSTTEEKKSNLCQFTSPLPEMQRKTLQRIPTIPCVGESSDSDYETSLKKNNFYSPGSSLEDLELARQRLMGQLLNVGTDSSQEDSAGEFLTPLKSFQSTDGIKLPSSPRNGDERSSDEGTNLLQQTPNVPQNTFSASKSVHVGSPSIFQASRGLCLPEPEKFASGISEHIPFENLPDSIGQFKKMKAVLKKIKTCISDQSR